MPSLKIRKAENESETLIISVSRFHKTGEKYVQNFGKISNFPKIILVWPVQVKFFDLIDLKI